MSKSFLTPLNLNGLELLNARLQQLASAPSSPTVGTIYYDTIAGNARVYSASGWIDIVASGAPTPGSVTNTSVATNAAISSDKLADGTTNGVYTLAERTKLAGVSNDAAAGVASQRTLGTGATQAAAGNDSRLADARNPIAGSVTNTSVAVGAAISSDKLADGTTNGVYTLTERSKLAGIAAGATANSSDATLLNRANHTGTESADVITDGTTNKAYTATEKTKLAGIATGATAYTNANALANPLNTFAVPTANIALNGFLVTGSGTPVNPSDLVTKTYADGLRQGVSVKDPVLVATTANISLTGEQTIDGVLTSGSRVLVKNQTTAGQNGIYVSASGAWARATDADIAAEVSEGTTVWVQSGTAQANSRWVMTTSGAITLGTTGLTFTQDFQATSAQAGNGLTGTGSSLNVGAGTGIVVGADTVGIDTTVVTRTTSFTIGDGTTTSFVLSHNYNKQGVMVQVYRNSGAFDEVEVDTFRTSVNTVTVTFAAAPASNAFVAVVQG